MVSSSLERGGQWEDFGVKERCSKLTPHLEPASQEVRINESECAGSGGVSRPLSTTTKATETLSIARHWIHECLKTHEECPVPKQGIYPTRLLDCGPADSSRCCLIETTKTDISGPYLALSHCWGGSESFKLTTDNYRDLCNGVPTSSLPQLYQDSLYVAQEMGVRYIWIDSLCIIQSGDSLADWKREAPLMSEVYSNALCTISAADAPDSYHSLFSDRNPDIVCPPTTHLWIDGKLARYEFSDWDLWRVEVLQAKVNTRAWVLQERLLSPRILYFGARQVFWECVTKEAAETNPAGLTGGSVGSDVSTGRGIRAALLSAQDADVDSILSYHWPNVVKLFTHCDLTFSRDKLVAVSALARMMSTISGEDYVAGMWKRTLERNLLWFKSRNGTSRVQPQVDAGIYRAPSWSWASVDGQIEPGRISGTRRRDVLIKAEDMKLDYVTDDKMGMIQGGWLRLRGTLLSVKLLRLDNPPRPEDGASWGIWIDWTPNKLQGLNYAAESETDLDVILDRPRDSFDQDNENGSLFCMPAMLSCRSGGIPNICVMLLLERLMGESGPLFRRIGCLLGEGDFERKVLGCTVGEEEFPYKIFFEECPSIYII